MVESPVIKTNQARPVALITGATGGLGRGIAQVLAEQGFDLALNDLEDRDLVKIPTDSGHHNQVRSKMFPADVSSEVTVRNMINQIVETFGRLDVLVNNAGITRSETIFETCLEDWCHVMDINLTGCFLCCKYAMEVMKSQHYGRIVNISSVAAQRGALYGHVHYAASKSGILGLTRTLARTGAPMGINVNAVTPGLIDTELLHRTHGSQIASLAKTIPLGLGTPRDIGLAVAFLVGEGSRYITGATLDVNGGVNIQ